MVVKNEFIMLKYILQRYCFMDISLAAVSTSQLLSCLFGVPSVVPGQLFVWPHHKPDQRTDSSEKNHLHILLYFILCELLPNTTVQEINFSIWKYTKKVKNKPLFLCSCHTGFKVSSLFISVSRLST